MQKFCAGNSGLREFVFPFFVSVEKCLMISTNVDISDSFRFKYSCHCNKKHICCEFEPPCDSGEEWDMMKNHEKLNTIWSWRRKMRSELLNPFFMLSLSDAFLRKRKSANAIWFSFICSRFFIFWFPLDGEKLQYPFFMKANEKHSGLCARSVVNGECLLNGFNQEWQVFPRRRKGFEKFEKVEKVPFESWKFFEGTAGFSISE